MSAAETTGKTIRVIRHCQRCGLDVNLGDWEQHRQEEAWAAVNNNPELFTEVGHE